MKNKKNDETKFFIKKTVNNVSERFFRKRKIKIALQIFPGPVSYFFISTNPLKNGKKEPFFFLISVFV